MFDLHIIYNFPIKSDILIVDSQQVKWKIVVG